MHTPTLPVLFMAHGSPTHTLDENRFNHAWKDLGQSLPRPKAIVCISAHWLTRGTFVTAMENPETIYDFGPFDDRLFAIKYPAPGSPKLAGRLVEKLGSFHLQKDLTWGLDHGSWCILRWLYPEADIPVVQLSIDAGLKPSEIYEKAKSLHFLRDEGVLVIASGALVHNLRTINFHEETTQFDWALEADWQFRQLISAGEHQKLINYPSLGDAIQKSVPTPDHYLPLLYALALQRPEDKVEFPVTGLAYGSISMTSVKFG